MVFSVFLAGIIIFVYSEINVEEVTNSIHSFYNAIISLSVINKQHDLQLNSF